MTIQPDLIAKLLDGRATARERAEVLAAADQSRELLTLLADSAAAANEVRVKSLSDVRTKRDSTFIPLALAASAMLAVSFGLYRRERADLPPIPTAIVATPPTLGATSVASHK